MSKNLVLMVKSVDVRDNFDRKRASQKRFTHLYVNPVNESVFENFLNRCDRPVGHYRLAALSALLSLGVDIEKVKLSWNQKAGCSMCPCSPGFIVKVLDGSFPLHKDIHVDVEARVDPGVTFEGLLRWPI